MTDPNLPEALRHLLEEAGYAWNEEAGVWSNRKLDRALDGAVARTLTPEQLRHWIAARTQH